MVTCMFLFVSFVRWCVSFPSFHTHTHTHTHTCTCMHVELGSVSILYIVHLFRFFQNWCVCASQVEMSVPTRMCLQVSKRAHSIMSMLGICQPKASSPPPGRSSPMAVDDGNLLGCEVVFLCQKDGTDDGVLLLPMEIQSTSGYHVL